MPIFRYEVVDRSGKRLLGAMNVSGEAEVTRRLTSKGYTVVRVVQAGANSASQATAAGVQSAGRHRSRKSAPVTELAFFFRTLASFLRAGLSTFEALSHSSAQTPNRSMRFISTRLADLVQSGETMSSAMEEFPYAFPPHVVGVVRAAEVGGFLAIVTEDIALDYELSSRKSAKWVKWVSGALWVNAVGTVLVAPLLPIMTGDFLKSGTTPDFASIFAKYLHWTGLHMALPMALVYLVGRVAIGIFRLPSMRYTAHSILLKTPFGFGTASRERSLASFTRILWRLQQAGVLPIKSWDAASYAAENVVVADRLHQQLEGVRAGEKYSQALLSTGLFQADDLRQVTLGEASGQVPDALQRTAAYYEDSAKVTMGRTKWFAIRVAIIANLIAIGVTFYCMEILPNTMAFDLLLGGNQ